MKIPKRIQPLVDNGIVDEVIRQLMSGKEATVYAVRCGDEIRCAKVYKEECKRSFKQAVQYQEGRNAEFAPELLDSHYAEEIWALFENGKLHPEVELSGYFEESTEAADVDSALLEIKAVLAEEQARRERLRDAEGPD